MLEMDTKIRERNNVTRDEDIGLTNYSELNLTMKTPKLSLKENLSVYDDSYSAALLAKMD